MTFVDQSVIIGFRDRKSLEFTSEEGEQKTMNIEKMITTLQQALAEAQKIAQVRQHQNIEIAHLWKFMIQPGQFAHDFYQDLGLDLAGFEAEIDQELDKISVVTGSNVAYGRI